MPGKVLPEVDAGIVKAHCLLCVLALDLKKAVEIWQKNRRNSPTCRIICKKKKAVRLLLSLLLFTLFVNTTSIVTAFSMSKINNKLVDNIFYIQVVMSYDRINCVFQRMTVLNVTSFIPYIQTMI